MPLLRFLTAVSFVCLQTGCSSALLSIGPDVDRYNSSSKTFTRAIVTHDLGVPTKTTPFPQSRSVASFLAEQHPAFQGCIFNRSARVSTIDEYVIRGHIENNKDAWASRSLAVITLGLSELVFLPAAIGETVSSGGETHHLYLAYSPTNILVAHHLIDVK